MKILVYPLLLCMAPLAGATLLVSDNFDAKIAGNLTGQGTAGTTGLTGNYTFGGTATGQSFTVVTGSLGFSTYNSTSGFSVLATSVGSGATNRIQTTGSFNVTGTLYSSYLVNFSSIGGATGSLAEVRTATNEGDSGASATTRFRLMADATSGTELRPGPGYDNAANATTTTLGLNTTYMVIGRFTNVGNALGPGVGASGIATLFALTASQYDSFIAAGGTDSYLDSAVVGTGAGEISARAADSAITTGTYTFSNGAWIQTAVSSASSATAQTYTYDAIRFGDSLTDVTVVPEPSTALLGLLASLGLTMRRKR